MSLPTGEGEDGVPLPKGEGEERVLLPKGEGTNRGVGADRLYDRAAPAMLAALVLVAAYYGRGLLLALAGTILFTLLLSRYWSRNALRDLTYQRLLDDERAFPDDEVRLTLRLSNDKLLPLAWLELDDPVPSGLAVMEAGGVPRGEAKGNTLALAASALWKERLLWRCRLRSLRRCVYLLGPARVGSGDPFGFFPVSARIGEPTRLVVYPRLIPVDGISLPPVYPLGERKAERWIFEDPSRAAGVREYRPEDPLRRIHWKATARRQQLQVRLQEPTTTLETVLFLAVDTFNDSRQRDADPRFEHAVSVVASLAHDLIGQRHPVGLYLNGGIESAKDAVELAPGSSAGHLIRILELLAAVQPEPGLGSDVLLGRVAPQLRWGTSLVVVVGSLPGALASTLEGLPVGGKRPTVLFAGSGRVPLPVGGDVHTVAVPSGEIPEAGSR